MSAGRTRDPVTRPAPSPPGATFAATVVRVDFGHCVIETAAGEMREALARGSLMGRRKALGNTVVVGDRVTVAAEAEVLMITAVEPRRNTFSRRAAGERPVEQVLASNLDQLVLVTSIAEPAFSPGFTDRVLAQAEHSGLPARLVINKLDLDAAHEAGAVLAAYAHAGYAGHTVCAKSGAGIDALRDVCRGLRSLFVGHSGVGKSTLLNALDPTLDLKSARVIEKTGKGRHTTTAAWLLRGASGIELIDTPGVRSFGLWGIEAAELERAYPEFLPHLGHCRFKDCSHSAEPGCAVRAAVEAGAIDPRRHAAFLQLRAELMQETALHTTRTRYGRL